MEIDDSSGDFHEFAKRLFELIEKLSGTNLNFDPGWQRVPPKPAKGKGRVCLYVRLLGEKATKNPKNSVHLSARWDLEDDPFVDWVHNGDNFFAKKSSVDFFARASESLDEERAKIFIRHMLSSVRCKKTEAVALYYSKTKNKKASRDLATKITQAVEDPEKAPEAAKGIMAIVGNLGPVTKRLIIDLVSSIICEAGKRVIFGG